jgi:crotonobetainyl-CoA:carnitine CoA-transferase CaiB-like acyl-CoA transferase
VGRQDLADDPRMANNAGRVVHEKELDAAIAAWTGTRPAAEVLATLEKAEVPGGAIYNVVDMVNDEHFKARGLFETVQVKGEDLTIPAMVPFLSDTPGRTEWPGPEIGAHNEAVFGGLLGLSRERIAQLQAGGAI